MRFSKIVTAPPDPILGLTEAFKKNSHPRKVNLGVGVYVDDAGATPILHCVKKAEQDLLSREKSKSYLPIAGSPEYGREVQELLFGKGHALLAGHGVRTAHTPGGTGALRLGAEVLKEHFPEAKVWLSSPTWANHKGIFAAAGFPIREYPYYDPPSRGIVFERTAQALSAIPEGDIVLLHVCCHNPTGVDFSVEQWREVAGLARTQRWFPFFDFAYQGFGEGLVPDRAGLLAMMEIGRECFISSSFSKNFGLYNERVGALTAVAEEGEGAEAVFSHIKKTARVIYSNPPAHGGAIVAAILANPELRSLWESEVAAMGQRILSVRAGFVEELHKRGVDRDFSFIRRQRGIFSFSGLSDAQVKFLREEKGIFMVGGGRINVAGINSSNLAYLCESIAEALKQAP